MLSHVTFTGELAVHAVLGALLAAAAVHDIRSLRIPNAIPLAIVALFAASYAGGLYHPFLPHLVSFLATAILGATLFYSDLWGGGDTKLMAAFGLFLLPYEIPRFVVATAVSGGILAAGLLATNRFRAPAARVKEMPYGVALAAGGLFSLTIPLG